MYWLKSWAMPLAILFAGMLIAASILFVDRWQISATGYGYASGDEPANTTERDVVYRLDRWSGKVEYCGLRVTDTGFDVVCPLSLRPQP